MADKFRTHKDGASLVLDDNERGVLVHLFSQLAEFVAPEDAEPHDDPLAAMVGIGTDDTEPEDPALNRLLPDAYPDDEKASKEFRRLTQDGLKARKLAGAVTVLETLHVESKRITLDPEQCTAWLTALTDLRLVLGSRLGITDDPESQAWDEDVAESDPRAAMLAVFDWLGYLQESLVRVLEKRLPTSPL